MGIATISRGSISKFALICLICGILGLVVTTAPACFVCIVPYQSILDKVEGSQQVIVARAVGKQQTKWQIVRVLRGSGIEVGQTVTTNSDQVIGSGQSQILWRAEPSDPWMIECPAGEELIGFLVSGVVLSSKLSELSSVREQAHYLRYFLPYLEHTHPQISDSAYNKLARAPYAVLRQVGSEMDPQQLMTWIKDPLIGPKRGSLYITLLGICGGESELVQIRKWIDEGWEQQDTENLGALLAAHAELNGEETIRFIEKSYLQNRKRKLGELIAAINTLRVHGQANGKISRARIVASFHLLLQERPALLEMIVEDCARWKEWTIAPKLMEIYACGKQPWNNAMIIKYLESCPTASAKRFVKQVAIRGG